MSIFILDMLDEIRQRVNDLGGDRGAPSSGYYVKWQEDDVPCLWKNAELVRAANWAIMELGKRNPILDSTTASICTIAVVDGTRSYALSPYIQTVESVRLVANGLDLEKTTQDILGTLGDWQSVEATPTQYFESSSPHKLSLYPLPIANGSLALTVRRRYTDSVDWDVIGAESEPAETFAEIDDEHREALVMGAISRLYRKRDPDAFNPKLAAEFDQEFTLLAGSPIDARTLETRRLQANLVLKIQPASYNIRSRRSNDW